MGKNRQEEINEDFSFVNISKASSKFNTPAKNPKSRRMMNIRVSKQAYYTFSKLHSRFIADTGLFESMRDTKDFWRLSLLEIKEHLENSNAYNKVPESFSNMVKKSGRRPAGSRRYLKDDLLATSFGNYEDETLEIYDDVMYSLALKEDMVHVKEYSRSYFFYDILHFLEKNIDFLIKKHKG